MKLVCVRPWMLSAGTQEKKCLLYFSLLLDFGIQIHLMVPTVLMA